MKGSAPKKAAAKPGGPPKKAPPAKASSAAAAPPPKKGGKAKEGIITYKFSNEGVEERFAEFVPEDQTANLSEKSWKLRLEGMLF